MIPVEGNSNLYRDEKTNAIINFSSHEYQEYISTKTKIIEDKMRIDNLENEIKEIKFLLLKLLENK